MHDRNLDGSFVVKKPRHSKNGCLLIHYCIDRQAYSQHNELIKAETLDLHARLMSERETWEHQVEILYLIMKERI